MSGDSRFAGLVIDVVFGAFRSPFRISQSLESLELVLRVPELGSGMRVASSWEPSDVLRQSHLVTQDVHLLPPLTLVLEPSVWNTLCQRYAYQIEVDKRMDWWVSPEEDFPVVINVLHDWSKTDTEHGQVFEGLPVPVNLDLLSLGAA